MKPSHISPESPKHRADPRVVVAVCAAFLTVAALVSVTASATLWQMSRQLLDKHFSSSTLLTRLAVEHSKKQLSESADALAKHLSLPHLPDKTPRVSTPPFPPDLPELSVHMVACINSEGSLLFCHHVDPDTREVYPAPTTLLDQSISRAREMISQGIFSPISFAVWENRILAFAVREIPAKPGIDPSYCIVLRWFSSRDFPVLEQVTGILIQPESLSSVYPSKYSVTYPDEFHPGRIIAFRSSQTRVSFTHTRHLGLLWLLSMVSALLCAAGTLYCLHRFVWQRVERLVAAKISSGSVFLDTCRMESAGSDPISRLAASLATGSTSAPNTSSQSVVRDDLYRRFFQSAPVMLLVLDRTDRILQLNRPLLAELTADPDELIGKKLTDLFTTASVQLWQEDTRSRFWRLGTIRDAKLTVTRRDGTSFPAILDGDTALGSEGEMVALLSIRNMAGKIEEEEELKISEQRLRFFFDLPFIGMAITTPLIHSWVQFNPRLREMFGYSAVELVRLTWEQLTHPDDRMADQLAREQMLAGQAEAHLCDKRFIRKDGSTFHAMSHTRVIRRPDGSVQFFATIIQDISEQKERERQLRDLLQTNENNRKAMLNLIRDSERAREELQAAKETADKASRAKGDFLAVMSHEIRTPMNGILGMTQALQRSVLTPAQQSLANTLCESSESLLSILNDVLDLSKIDVGRVILEAIPFPLSEPVSLCTDFFRTKAIEKNLSLQLSLDPSLPDTVVGDPARLRQILLNLIGNAVKFTHAGSVTISAKKKAEGAGWISILFSVKDTGIGIPAEALERIFQKFEQADASTTRSFGGTGLGLAICKNLVELMQGSISVESQLGAGSNFQFHVTLGTAPHDTETPPPIRKSRTFEILQPSKKLKILCAEDIPTNQRVAQLQVESIGHEIHLVANGAEAIRELSTNRYDVVLMDIRMPELDGVDATRIIRDPQSPVLDHNIPIIALTANTSTEEKNTFFEAGMNDFLPKPIREEDLFLCLERIATPSGPDSLCDHEATPMDQLDEEIAQEVAQVFEETVPDTLSQFCQAITESSWKEAARLAHGLRSPCAMFGFQAAAALCKKVELLCDTQPPEGIGTLSSEFCSAITDCVKQLKLRGSP